MTEIVARGRVTRITPGPGSAVVTVRKSEQRHCPRCHGTDVESLDAACAACGVKYHADCLSTGCVSFNCRIVGTVGGTRGELAPIEWGDWQETPGASVTVTRSHSARLQGPSPREESTGWRYGWHRVGGRMHGPNPLVEVPRYRWDRVTLYTDELVAIDTYRIGRADGAIVTVEFTDSEGDDRLLLTTDRIIDEEREMMVDGGPDDYVDNGWLLDLAQGALADGRTVDFSEVWADEVDSILEYRDASDCIDGRYDECESDVELSEAFTAALDGWDPDFMVAE